MILVFSEKDDISAMKTKQWLEFFNAHFIVVEDTNLMDLNLKLILKKGNKLFLSNITV